MTYIIIKNTFKKIHKSQAETGKLKNHYDEKGSEIEKKKNLEFCVKPIDWGQVLATLFWLQ